MAELTPPPEVRQPHGCHGHRTYREVSAEDLHKISEGCLIVRIDEDQILREQKPNDVVWVSVEHRNAAETTLEDLRKSLKDVVGPNVTLSRQTGDLLEAQSIAISHRAMTFNSKGPSYLKSNVEH